MNSFVAACIQNTATRDIQQNIADMRSLAESDTSGGYRKDRFSNKASKAAAAASACNKHLDAINPSSFG